MKFAVLTDIHGNSDALRAVLKEIDSIEAVDHIYCLGDMIGIGPDSNEVLYMLFARRNVSMITGNHDEAILALLKGEKYPESHLHAREHHRWIAERLDPAFIPKIEQLPRIIEREIEQHSILFCHYQFRPGRESHHISEDPFSSIENPSLVNLETLFFNRKEQAIFFGHHHPVHYFKNDRALFVNPGSLGCTDEPAALFAIVEVNTEGMEVHLKKAAYDNTRFLLSYEKLKVPDRDFILKTFHGNQGGKIK